MARNPRTAAPPHAVPGEDLATPDQVAHRYNVPVRTLEMWRYRRTGPRFVKLNGHVRYRWSDLAAWEAAQTRGGGDAA
jgi:N-acyl-D-aspartate/D-glutamate deacylase